MAILIKAKDGLSDHYTVICSSYFPIDTDAPPEPVAALTKYCEDRDIPLVMGCDSNCHHTLWGCKQNNSRGNGLVEFLSSKGLDIANKGCASTFLCNRGQSVIDLTVCTPSLLNRIRGWAVSEEASMSDHRHILYIYLRF